MTAGAQPMLRLPHLMHTDAVAAARVLARVPPRRRAWVMHRMLAEAAAADRWRRHSGQPHPVWGDVSLMAAAMRRPAACEPLLCDPAWCRTVAFVYLTLAHGTAGTLPLERKAAG
jgi:hypothetical protein